MKRRWIRMSLVLAMVFGFASYVVGECCVAQHQHSAARSVPPRAAGPRPVATPQPAKEITPTIDAKRLTAIEEAVARAIGHLQAGHQQEALTELKLVQGSLASLRQALERGAASSFVNDRCPIMGTPIDPTKVTAALTRVYEGQKVAFCCASCPQTWDQLANSEKTAKLASVTVQAARPGTPSTNAPNPSPTQGMQHAH